MSSPPRVLLLDDGELEDVRLELEKLGADLKRLRGSSIPEQLDPPADLFVTTARHADIAGGWPRAPRPVRIGIASEESNSLEAIWRRNGIGILVHRPVHPAALRALLLRALYGGREKRVEPRFPVGHPIVVHSDRRKIEAMLVDLSMSGARLLLRSSLGFGARIRIEMGPDITGDGTLLIEGCVLRNDYRETGDKQLRSSISLVFDKLPAETWRDLQRIIESLASGPVVFPEAPPSLEG